ncbi:hypothetical protein BRADI_3g33496v3, partial [Brachypodium distachyon]
PTVSIRIPDLCRQWLSGARTVQPLLPPLLPWAVLPNGTFLSLPDGAVHRLHAAMPEDGDVAHRISTGGGKGLLFLVHHDGRCSLMHLLSRDMTPQWIYPESLMSSWPRRSLHDNICKAIVSDDNIRGIAARPRFDVFEAADLSSDGHGRWVKVDTLMRRALFISESCSESLPAGGGGGAREYCIYFMTENDVGEEIMFGVHDMREGTTVAPLKTFPVTLRNRRQWPPAWLFRVET